MSGFVLASALILGAASLRLATAGSLGDLAAIEIRGEVTMVVVFLLVQALPIAGATLGAVRPVILPAWLALMAVLLALCAANARSSCGFRLITAGVASNLAVILLNGGMPVSAAAVNVAGGEVASSAFSRGNLFHVALHAATKLPLLADVLPAPGFQGLRGVLSIGDVLMYTGLIVVVVAAVRGSQVSTRFGPSRQGGRR